MTGRGTVRKICKICGATFKTVPAKTKGNLGSYCSNKCYAEARDKKVKRNCLFCGKEFMTKLAKVKYKEGKFCSKSCSASSRTGDKGSNWKGGRIILGSGYVCIKTHEHPYRDKHNYVFEHRLVMEKHIGRYLKPEERVHHINGIKSDNRIVNLMLFNNQQSHRKFEMIQEGMQKGEIILDGRNIKEGDRHEFS